MTFTPQICYGSDMCWDFRQQGDLRRFKRGLTSAFFGAAHFLFAGVQTIGAAPADVFGPTAGNSRSWSHMADASAGEGLGNGLFVAANDEDNVLRVYRLQQGGAPIATWDATPHMALAGKSTEMDIEGSAKINDTLYWITSHAPNREGKPRPNRKRFFATHVTVVNGKPAFHLAGKPVSTLLADLDRDPRYVDFKLAQAALRPPKTKESLNIEALCDTPESGLLIGFRAPVIRGKALLAPLLNPAETVAGQPPRFGDPLLLDLAGNGIRAMTRTDGTNYFIMAGSPLSGGTFQLYRWDGHRAPKPDLSLLTLPSDATPEGLIAIESGDIHALLVLSDDGMRLVNGKPAKSLPDPARKSFRGYFLRLP